jgi:hypothetical protein
MTPNQAIKMLEKSRELTLRAIEECRAAIMAARARWDDYFVMVWMDSKANIQTTYTPERKYIPGSVPLAVFRGAGGSESSYESAKDEAEHFGIDDIITPLQSKRSPRRSLGNFRA